MTTDDAGADGLEALAAGPLDERDDAILEAVAAHYAAADPVPPTLIDRIGFAITLDALDAEVAELVRDSDTELAGVRSSGADSYSVTFTTATTTIMVTVSPQSVDAVRVDGWVTPGAHVAVDLRSSDSVLTTVADEDGRFSFDPVPRGFAQFIVRPAGDENLRSVITPAIEL